MDRRLIFPRFENPPPEYDKRYFDNLTNMLNVLMIALRSPGEGRQTTMVFTHLPSNDYGLEPGSLFEINGALYVSVAYRSFPNGVSGTGGAGSVTVTTV